MNRIEDDGAYGCMQQHSAQCTFLCSLCLFFASSCNTFIDFTCQELTDIGLNLDFTWEWTETIPPERLWAFHGLLSETVGNSDGAGRGSKSGNAELGIASKCENIHLLQQFQIPHKQHRGAKIWDLLQPGVLSSDCNWILAPSKHPWSSVELPSRTFHRQDCNKDSGCWTMCTVTSEGFLTNNNPHQVWRGRTLQAPIAAFNSQRSSTPSLLGLRPPLPPYHLCPAGRLGRLLPSV